MKSGLRSHCSTSSLFVPILTRRSTSRRRSRLLNFAPAMIFLEKCLVVLRLSFDSFRVNSWLIFSFSILSWSLAHNRRWYDLFRVARGQGGTFGRLQRECTRFGLRISWTGRFAGKTTTNLEHEVDRLRLENKKIRAANKTTSFEQIKSLKDIRGILRGQVHRLDGVLESNDIQYH